MPVLEMIISNCQQFGMFYELLSIDESMIPNHGHHSLRQFIRNKPITLGYEMWMLSGVDGYPYNIFLHIVGKKVTQRLAIWDQMW